MHDNQILLTYHDHGRWIPNEIILGTTVRPRFKLSIEFFASETHRECDGRTIIDSKHGEVDDRRDVLCSV